MDEIDIWQAAKLLIRQHGNRAEFEAAKYIRGMVKRGDFVGEAGWKRVLRAIEQSRNTSATDSAKVH
jgi:hypothetical protein